jgi:hypothetical protein
MLYIETINGFREYPRPSWYVPRNEALPFQGLDAEGGVGVDAGRLRPGEGAGLLPLPAVTQRADQRRVESHLAAHRLQHRRPVQPVTLLSMQGHARQVDSELECRKENLLLVTHVSTSNI